MHSKPHVFKITRDADGKATMVVKKWSTDTQWSECIGSARGQLVKEVPINSPKLTRPDYDDMDFYRLKSDVESMFRYMLKEDDKKAWSDWFQETEQKLQGIGTNVIRPNNNLLKSR